MAEKMSDTLRDLLERQVRRMNLNAYQRVTEKIGSGRDHWAMHGLAIRADFDAYLLMKRGRLDLAPKARLAPDGLPVTAFINDNRWLTRCECGGLGVVDRDDPGFWCHRCMNSMNNHTPRPVWFPPPGLCQRAERVLSVSKDPLWRNISFLAEDGDQPGEAKSNRIPTIPEVLEAIKRAEEANIAAGLPKEVKP